jgi:hypothetical protein
VKAARGEFTGGDAPYGWEVGADGVHLAEQLGEQNVVSQVRAMSAKGLSLRRIAQELAAGGHRSRTGRAFGPEQIRRMLSAPPRPSLENAGGRAT